MDDLLQQGIIAYKAGKRDEARKYFIAAIKQDRDNERAWQFMYNVANDDKERLSCLQQILRINPKNEKASVLLNQLNNVEIPSQTTVNMPPRNDAQHKEVSLKQCPYCAEKILRDAIVCRFCGRELPNGKIPSHIARNPAPAQKAKSNPLLVLILIGLIAVLCLCVFTFATSSTSTPENPATPTMASIMCEKFVTDRLKAPSTAKFAPYRELKITTYGKNEGVKDAFRVIGYVDAQNGFGAMLRNNYICDVQYIGDDNWRLINLEIE